MKLKKILQMPSKKTLAYIFTVIIVIQVFFGLFNAPKTFAQPLLPNNPNTPQPYISTNMFGLSHVVVDNGVWSWPFDKIPGIFYYLVWTPASWLMGLGGLVMDKGIDFSISGPVFRSFANSDAVTKGWGLGRDIVNLFLIFILLYIAIATILQVSGFNTKQLLTTLIIIAFLVNFSLVITRLIVDAANVLTVGFYNSFEKDASGKISISNTFRNALDSEKLIDQQKALDPKTAVMPSLTRLLSMLLGTAVMLIAGFIFLIFGILFIIRAVVLIILMILSPLAFAARILPSTQKHSSTWWHELFSQAFFAPAAMFMLWVSAQVAAGVQNSTFKQTAFGTNNKDIMSMMITQDWNGIAVFMLQFVIIIILLFASLVVAKKMGAAGAEAVQKGVTKGLRKAQGYAGRISKTVGTIAAGRAAEGLMKTGAGRIPVVGRGLAKLSGMESERRKKQVETYKKGYSNYSDAALDALEHDPTVISLTKKEALKEVRSERSTKDKKKKEAQVKEYEKEYGNRNPEELETMKNDPTISKERRDIINVVIIKKEAEEKKRKKTEIRKAEKTKKDTELDELINQIKSDLSKERESSVPDIKKIFELEQVLRKLKDDREKSELAEESSERLEEMEKELAEVKTIAEEGKETAEEAKTTAETTKKTAGETKTSTSPATPPKT